MLRRSCISLVIALLALPQSAPAQPNLQRNQVRPPLPPLPPAIMRRAPLEPPIMNAGAPALLFTPDGKTIITANGREDLSVRDGVTGAELRQIKSEHGNVSGLTLSPDGKTLAVACVGDGTGAIRLWSLPDWKAAGAVLRGHPGGVETVAFSANGKTLASAGADGIRLWDVATGKELKSISTGGTCVTGLAFTPDGKTLASAGTCLSRHAGLPFIDSDDIRLWHVESGKQNGQVPLKGHAVAFSADGRHLIAGGYGVYGVPPGEKASIVINQVAFRPMNRVALWDVAMNKEIAAVENMGNAFALSGDGRFFAVGRGSEYHIGRHQGGGVRLGSSDNTRTLTLRESLTGQPIHVFPMPEGAVAVALAPDGTRLAVARPNGTIGMLDIAPKSEKRTLELMELDRLWSNLGGEAGPAHAAVWSLIGAPEQAVPFLKTRLAPVKWDREKTKKWIDDLDSEDFDTRETAAKELRKRGSDVDGPLRARLANEETSAEVRRAIKELLEAIEGRSLPPEELRAVRSVLVLERAATPTAREVLKALAGGEPEARLTREASHALARLQSR